MSVRVQVAFMLGLMIQAVLFGAATVALLAVPALAEHARLLFPYVIAGTLMVSPPLAWRLAPHLRSRSWRDRIAFAG